MAPGRTTEFFDLSQTSTNVAAGETSDTIASDGYLFTRSMDKWWYPGISIGPGTPTGRYLRVTWPEGIEAQAVTAGPSGLLNPGGKAKITIRRADGAVFDISSMKAKLLANTAGAGGAIEVMPKLHGEDGLPDPLMLQASGYAGQTFSYNTPTLTGYDAYDFTLYVDFALTGLTAIDATAPPPPELLILQSAPGEVTLRWPAEAVGYSLEETADPSQEPFTTVPSIPVLEGSFYSVTLPVTESNKFFRLKSQ